MSQRRAVFLWAWCLCLLTPSLGLAGAPTSFAEVYSSYTETVRPILERYCLKCHNADQFKGDLDLERMTSLMEIRRDPRVWQNVVFMLESGEMPPKKSAQLSAEESKRLRGWIDAYLKAEAYANAGDPGAVVLRRLSNVEYNRTVHDLTGVDFRPAHEFPADSAAGEGFTNTGESLVMSPALIDKYLAAAQDVARHAVLLPDGFRFSKATARRDLTDEVVDQIREIHARHTEVLEFRDEGNVTRIRWGRVDLLPYVRSLIEHRELLRSNVAAVDQVAASAGINAHYLHQLSRLLVGERDLSALLASVQARLLSASLADAPSIVEEIETWQNQVWELKNVGQMFNQGQEPVDRLAYVQEFRLPLRPKEGSEILLSLAAGDAGDGGGDDKTKGDVVVWENPRFERQGMPPLLLRDLRPFLKRLAVFRHLTLSCTKDYLNAVAAAARETDYDLAALARERGLDREILRSWVEYLNLPPPGGEFATYAPRPGRILLMVGDPKSLHPGDAGLTRYLRGRGHHVTLYQPRGQTSRQQYDAAMANDVAIISESIAATDVEFKGEQSLKNVPRPILSFEPYVYDDAGWTGTEVFWDFGHTGTSSVAGLQLDELSDSLHVAPGDHPLGLGLSDEVRVYHSPYSLAFGIPGAEAAVIASADAAAKYPVQFVYNQGDRLADGSVAPAARIALYLGQAAADNPDGNHPTDWANLTFAGRALINAAIEYAIDSQRIHRPSLKALADVDRSEPWRDVDVTGLLAHRTHDVEGHEFIDGWDGPGHPSLVANSSLQSVRIPGIVPPHSVMVHPTPTHFVAVGWRSPINGLVRVEVAVVDAHPEAGNGQTWSLNLQQGTERQRLAGAAMDHGTKVRPPPLEDVMVRKGDFLSLLIGPRDGDWACDSTRINLVVTETADPLRSWNLAGDVADDIHAGNPHPDRFGNQLVWYFFKGKVGDYDELGAPMPNGSLLANWRAAMLKADGERADHLADRLTELLTSDAKAAATASPPDRVLYHQVRAATSPLFKKFDYQTLLTRDDLPLSDAPESDYGLATERFTHHPGKRDEDGSESHATHIVLEAPHAIRVRLPADLIAGRDFVVDGRLAPTAMHGTVQLKVTPAEESPPVGLDPDLAVVVREGSVAEQRMQKAFADFRGLFPRVMCCRTIVPLDEVVTLVMYHREDEPLSRLLLSESERARLDRLWTEVRYISQDALEIQEAYPLFMEFASQVGDVPKFSPLREPIRKRAEEFAKWLEETEPIHLEALIAFAERAFRRPLDDAEKRELRDIYRELRAANESHDEAFRGVLTRILVAPSFLYRIEQPRPGDEPGRANDWELATRLSYFLWSTMPDEALRQQAAAGRLQDPEVLAREARRMLRDYRVRGLATEFACQWLGFRDFDTYNEKNERQYPTFAELRGAMYEESVRFFVDLLQRDGGVFEIIDADHTFLNGALARHYGIGGAEGSEGADDAEGDTEGAVAVDGDAGRWVRVDGMKRRSRGGVLGMATMLSKQSGATRTSPILRGHWVVETLLGERLPDPPANVPELPDAVSRDGLTVRELTEKHVSAAECAGCHSRIDPFGFALEAFDAIGRFRERDFVDKPVDAHVKLSDGTEFAGIKGLRSYLMSNRRNDFLRQFCRKLLGFALGRSVELSDEPLIETMIEELARHDFRFSAAVETIVRSQQFRYHRGLEATRETSE